MGPSQYIDPLIAQQQLSDDEYLLRKEFAKLFCDSHNAYTACAELGIAKPYIEDWAKSLMACCVTRQLIKEEQKFRNSEEGLIDARQLVLSKLQALGDFAGPGSSHGARVSAWMGYAKIVGLDIPVKPAEEIGYRGGVMVVPALTSADDWGSFAAQSQALLKESVKD